MSSMQISPIINGLGIKWNLIHTLSFSNPVQHSIYLTSSKVKQEVHDLYLLSMEIVNFYANNQYEVYQYIKIRDTNNLDNHNLLFSCGLNTNQDIMVSTIRRNFLYTNSTFDINTGGYAVESFGLIGGKVIGNSRTEDNGPGHICVARENYSNFITTGTFNFKLYAGDFIL